MKMEISFFPPEYTYPFEINGESKNIVEFSCYIDGEFSDAHEDFFCKWMEIPDYYPIYSLAEIYDFQQAEYEELFELHNIKFTYTKGSRKDTFFVKAIISNPKQFKEYFPYLHGNGSMLNLSLGSLNQDIFRLEEREYESPYPVKRTKKNQTRLVKIKWVAHTPIITLTESSTMFWVGYDGDYITAFSNNKHFSTVEFLQKIMPEKVELVRIEYGGL
ncbi:hypothetical protein LG307_02810 [Sutcliffiella horikoshii]|uniref:hypothetical protein n=1 Tax=Sutcliffiella horikoshii TaxID=79883 RepID=UPI00384BF5B9